MKILFIAIVGALLSFGANATETRIELNGVATSNECIIFLRDFDKDMNEKWVDTGTTRLELSCKDLVKSGLAFLDKDQGYRFSRKALRMKPDEFFEALHKIGPPIELVAVSGCVPLSKDVEGDQTVTLAKEQAVCLDTGEYESVVMGDATNWKLVGQMLVPSTAAGHNTLYVVRKGQRKPVVVRINRAS